jgi:hypothetical protein
VLRVLTLSPSSQCRQNVSGKAAAYHAAFSPASVVKEKTGVSRLARIGGAVITKILRNMGNLSVTRYPKAKKSPHRGLFLGSAGAEPTTRL